MSGVYGWSTGKGGVHFHRLAEPFRVLRDHGIEAETGQVLDNAICERFDTIVVHMLWDERNSQAWERLAISNQHRMIFDIDDVMWAPDWEPFAKHYTPGVLKRVSDNIRLAHVVTTPSEYIAERVASIHPFGYDAVKVVPNTVPEHLLHRKMRDRSAPTLGYQGSPSHLTDVSEELRHQLGWFLHEQRDWVLRLWGADPKTVPAHLNGRLVHTPWADSVTEYYKTVSMDIGLGPLSRTRFNAGKSALRAIEYAALGIPAVLTDWNPYRGWVDDGVTGFLIGTDENWYDPLMTLAEDPELRAKMGRAARERAAGWTTEANVHRWVDAWNSV
jgi:hypothetical protein